MHFVENCASIWHCNAGKLFYNVSGSHVYTNYIDGQKGCSKTMTIPRADDIVPYDRDEDLGKRRCIECEEVIDEENESPDYEYCYYCFLEKSKQDKANNEEW